MPQEGFWIFTSNQMVEKVFQFGMKSQSTWSTCAKQTVIQKENVDAVHWIIKSARLDFAKCVALPPLSNEWWFLVNMLTVLISIISRFEDLIGLVTYNGGRTSSTHDKWFSIQCESTFYYYPLNVINPYMCINRQLLLLPSHIHILGFGVPVEIP